MRKLRVWALVLVVLAVAVAGTLAYRSRANAPIARPRVGPVIEAVYGLGTVVAPRTFQLKTAVNLVLRKVYVKEGDQVRAGTPLVRFDEPARTQAPFDGIVTSVPFREGEVVFPQVPVVTLVNLEGMYLEVSLEQQAALRVRQGQGAVVTFESLQSQRFSGRVASIFPKENQFIVRIDLEKFPQGALPGMTADTAIQIGRRENVLSVPLRAVADGKVTVVREGHRRKVPVQLGVVDGQWAEVLSGDIKQDDEVVMRGP